MAAKHSVEFTVLQNLIVNEEYTRKVLPFLKDEYFKVESDKLVYRIVDEFFTKYNKAPTREVLAISLQEKHGVPEKIFEETMEKIESFSDSATVDVKWATDLAEKFCKERALYNAITQSILIADGQDKKHGPGAIPTILQEALSVSFDSDVGHDYLESAEARYAIYSENAKKIAIRHATMNQATAGGIESQTLNLFLAPSNVGKTIMLCDLAAGDLEAGRNVLYITMEMAEHKIAERIDCNLLDIELKNLKKMKKGEFISRVDSLKQKTRGKLFVKQYPTGAAHVGHFRALLEELRNKKEFVPDVIYIDYLGIVASQKYKSSNYNSYHAMGFVAQELRGLAVEFGVAIWSAIQTNRSGYNNTDLDETSTAESMSVYHIADLVWAIIRTEELDKMGQVMFKQLKSRYSNKAEFSRFVMGININKFKLFDIDTPTQLVDTASISMVSSAPQSSGGFDQFKF
jgi:replicative DNA helicase